jgi:hypothetical protein
VAHRGDQPAFPVRHNEHRATPGLTVREHMVLELLASLGDSARPVPGRPDSGDIGKPDGQRARVEWAIAQVDILLEELEATGP